MTAYDIGRPGVMRGNFLSDSEREEPAGVHFVGSDSRSGYFRRKGPSKQATFAFYPLTRPETQQLCSTLALANQAQAKSLPQERLLYLSESLV